MLLEDDFQKAIDALNATAQSSKYHHMNVEALFDVVKENYKNSRSKKSGEFVEFLMNNEIKKHPTIISYYGSKDLFKKFIENFIEENEPELLEILRKRFFHLE